MQKNIKGFVSLIAGIIAFVFIIIAFIPTTQVRDTSVNFYGSINPTLALIAIPFSIIAIVAGVMSRKDKDKKGPRKAGIIVGVIAVILAVATAAITFALSMITTYANDPDDSMFSNFSDQQKKDWDKIVDNLINGEETK